MVSGVIEALEGERAEQVAALETLEKEWADKRMSADAKHRANKLNEAIEEFDTKIELTRRDLRMKEIKERAEAGATEAGLPHP